MRRRGRLPGIEGAEAEKCGPDLTPGREAPILEIMAKRRKRKVGKENTRNRRLRLKRKRRGKG